MKSDIGTELATLCDTPLYRSRLRKRLDAGIRRNMFSILAAVGIFGGISALFVGLVFTIIHGLVRGDVMFDRAGTITLVAAIPMILIGSIFLDAIEVKTRHHDDSHLP